MHSTRSGNVREHLLASVTGCRGQRRPRRRRATPSLFRYYPFRSGARDDLLLYAGGSTPHPLTRLSRGSRGGGVVALPSGGHCTFAVAPQRCEGRRACGTLRGSTAAAAGTTRTCNGGWASTTAAATTNTMITTTMKLMMMMMTTTYYDTRQGADEEVPTPEVICQRHRAGNATPGRTWKPAGEFVDDMNAHLGPLRLL
jgi:hypothetical protein